MKIHPEHRISLGDVINMLRQPADIELSQDAISKIAGCRNWLENHLQESENPIYGINTGFGSLCNTLIDNESLERLQENLIKSHAVGMGEAMPEEVSKLMLWFKVHSLSKGFSGVRVETAHAIVSLFNARIHPVVYEFGSLGASGDLAPLAHLFLPFVGDGQIWTENEGPVRQPDLWKNTLPSDFKLASKEGIALLNGTQFMSSIGALALVRAYHISYCADLIASLSLDAFDARPEPFDQKLHLIRLQKGQKIIAQRVREMLDESPTFSGKKEHVQDPYSFRCIPQVHGASHQVLEYVRSVVENEINSVSDNPTIFPGEEVLSGGNFHGQAIAMALDHLAVAISEWGSISERRVFQLISGSRGMPAFLTVSAGLNSGLMIPQYTAASIASRNKMLCFPASADSIPSSNNQEDHVSMGANGATRLFQLLDNVEQLLSIELFTASQALYVSGRKTSPFLESILESYRSEVPVVDEDRVFHFDLQKSVDFLRELEVDEELLLI